MTERLRSLVDVNAELAFLRGGRLDLAAAEVDNRIDHGRLHVAADHEFLLRRAAHYLIYGSEWTLAVLGSAGHRFLKSRGAPTLLVVDLPLRRTDAWSRRELAGVLIREWTRRACNRPDWIPVLDFTFTLGIDLPPDCIVGHHHPAELRDPLYGYATYRCGTPVCAHCATIRVDPRRPESAACPRDAEQG